MYKFSVSSLFKGYPKASGWQNFALVSFMVLPYAMYAETLTVGCRNVPFLLFPFRSFSLLSWIKLVDPGNTNAFLIIYHEMPSNGLLRQVDASINESVEYLTSYYQGAEDHLSEPVPDHFEEDQIVFCNSVVSDVYQHSKRLAIPPAVKSWSCHATMRSISPFFSENMPLVGESVVCTADYIMYIHIFYTC